MWVDNLWEHSVMWIFLRFFWRQSKKHPEDKVLPKSQSYHNNWGIFWAVQRFFQRLIQLIFQRIIWKNRVLVPGALTGSTATGYWDRGTISKSGESALLHFLYFSIIFIVILYFYFQNFNMQWREERNAVMFKCQHSNMLVTKHSAWLNFLLPWIANNLQSYQATGLILLLNWQSFDPGICHLACKKKIITWFFFFCIYPKQSNDAKSYNF